MKADPYARFKDAELVLRDYLAADRTILANERTLLSYIRTALAFGAASAALIHFFDSVAAEVLGWALLPVAIAIVVIGVQRFLPVRRRLARIMDKSQPAPL